MEKAFMALAEQAQGKQALTTLRAIEKLQSRLKPYVQHPQTGMHYGEQAKYVSWRFGAMYSTLELLHLTDQQFGHVECQVDRIEEYNDWVLDKPNRFVLLGGDCVDAGNIFSPGQPWEQICSPQGQVYKFCDLMAPIRHRILGYVGGNHERRGLKTFGDLGLLIAMLLKVPYSNGRQLIDIQYGQHQPFKVDLWHGRGAARTKGAKVMMLWNYVMEHPGADLYLAGHLHDCFVLPFHREQRLPSRNNIHITKHYAGMSSSFLNTWGTYSEVAGMSITDVLMLRTVLEPNGRSEVTVR